MVNSSAHTAVGIMIMRSGTACAVTNRIWNVITDPVPALFPTLQRILHTGMEVVLPPTGEVVSCGAALTMNVTLHFTRRRTTSLENVEYDPISVNTC